VPCDGFLTDLLAEPERIGAGICAMTVSGMCSLNASSEAEASDLALNVIPHAAEGPPMSNLSALLKIVGRVRTAFDGNESGAPQAQALGHRAFGC
jgi:hypothetical protein